MSMNCSQHVLCTGAPDALSAFRDDLLTYINGHADAHSERVIAHADEYPHNQGRAAAARAAGLNFLHIAWETRRGEPVEVRPVVRRHASGIETVEEVWYAYERNLGGVAAYRAGVPDAAAETNYDKGYIAAWGVRDGVFCGDEDDDAPDFLELIPAATTEEGWTALIEALTPEECAPADTERRLLRAVGEKLKRAAAARGEMSPAAMAETVSKALLGSEGEAA